LTATRPSETGPPTQADLARRIADAALELGFARVGFARVERFDEAGARLRNWLASGYHGALSYLAEGGDRADPRALLPGAKTLVAVALSYAEPRGTTPLRSEREGHPLTGSVARYARGEDYHLVMKKKLSALAERCEALLGRPVVARACVDTAPLLEHEVARRAGLGFSGKSTLTIVPGLGSWVLLGELLLDVELPPSEPVRAGCGGCRLCLDACPTGAFVDAVRAHAAALADHDADALVDLSSRFEATSTGSPGLPKGMGLTALCSFVSGSGLFGFICVRTVSRNVYSLVF